MSSWEDELAALARDAKLTSEIDRFFFLRHGETDFNKANVVQGSVDIPLNATGEAQAAAAAALLVGQPISHIISSPQRRAHRTAEIVAGATGHADIRLEAGLREKGFGAYEGKAAPEQSVWSFRDEGAEPLADFAGRVVGALNTHLVEGVPLIVAHGGVRRVIMLAMGLTQANRHYGNAVPMEFIRAGKVWTVRLLD